MIWFNELWGQMSKEVDYFLTATLGYTKVDE